MLYCVCIAVCPGGGGGGDSDEIDKRLKAAADSVFGSNPLPKLEKFTFKVRAAAFTQQTVTCTLCTLNPVYMLSLQR